VNDPCQFVSRPTYGSPITSDLNKDGGLETKASGLKTMGPGY